MSQNDPSKHFTPLAPGPSSRVYTGQTSMEVGRSKKNSMACLQCKGAKRKCSGTCPCAACEKAGEEDKCFFDPTKDMRRKIAMKQTVDTLNGYKDLLDALLTTIRLSPQTKVLEIIRLIKSNGSMQEIAQAVARHAVDFSGSSPKASGQQLVSEDLDQDAKSSLRELLVSTSGAAKNPSRMPSSPVEERHTELPRVIHPYARVTLESLCDIPVVRASAKPWTEVTDDDDLVSHLVSLYFTWDHPCAQFVDQHIFLSHMKRGDLSSEFCSPLLVNSLLSIASTYSDTPGLFSDPENAFSRGQIFFDEAERLLKPQEGLATLTNIQAILMMCCVLSQQGNKSRAWWLLRGAVQMAQDIGLFKSPKLAQPLGRMSPEMERVRAITAWAVFNLNIIFSMQFDKVANLSQPVSELNVGEDNDIDWTPYPRSNQINYTMKPAHLPQVRLGLSNLAIILDEFQALMLDEGLHGSFRDLMNRAKAFYEPLQQWLENSPSASQIGTDPSPQLLIVRIQYLQATMYLIETLIKRCDDKVLGDRLRQDLCEHAEEIAQYLRLYRQSYGMKHVPSQVVYVVQTGLRVLVDQLDDRSNMRDTFLEFCQFGVALGQKYRTMADSLHDIQLRSQQGAIKLPAAAITILDGSESRKWQE